MQKEVLIHVRGLQMMDAQGDQEPIEIIVPGQYYFRNGSHYLRYEELLDETAEPHQLHKSIRKGSGGQQEGTGQCTHGI